MTPYEEIHAQLCAPGQFFEMETVDVRGRPTRTWKHAPATLGELLEQGARNGGDQDFLVLDGERMTHREHLDQVQRLARALVDDLGVRPGDRVAIAMRNLPEWSVAFFAAAAAGAIAAPLNAFGSGSDLAFALADCAPVVLLADGSRLERLAPYLPGLQGLEALTIIGTRLDDRRGEHPLPDGVRDFADVLAPPGSTAPDVSVDPDDPATLFYTSGSSASPKGVLGTHRNITNNLFNLMFGVGRTILREPDAAAGAAAGRPVLLTPVPLFHATGCHGMLVSQAYFGGCVVLMRRWDPEAALELIEQESVTSLGGAPAMLWDLLNSASVEQRDLSSLGTVGGGGAASPPELLRRLKEQLPQARVSAGYGMTETSSITTYITGGDFVEHPSSVGLPIPVCEVRVVDVDDEDVPVGETGEVWVAGPNVVPGYWNRPQETAAAFVEGWVRTGDIGRLDEDGYLYIVDRAKDIVIRGGENISSAEVEAALFEHSQVLEAAVFAVPHPTLGEEVGAVVRVSGAATSDELRAHVAERLAAFKVPSHLWVTDEPMPRTPNGKLLKREVRARHVPPGAP